MLAESAEITKKSSLDFDAENKVFCYIRAIGVHIAWWACQLQKELMHNEFFMFESM